MSATAALDNHANQSSMMDSLTSAFNFVAKGALLYVGFGAIDLALWHYDPGGLALFETIKEPILSLLDVTGVSDALGWLADAIGSGAEQLAVDPILDTSTPDLGLEQVTAPPEKVVHHFGDLDHSGCTEPH